MGLYCCRKLKVGLQVDLGSAFPEIIADYTALRQPPPPAGGGGEGS